MRREEIQIKTCDWFDKVYGNTYSSAVAHFWDEHGKKTTTHLPFAYGSEPKRKILLKMFEEGLIPADNHYDLEVKHVFVIEVINLGRVLKRECVEFGLRGG